MNFLNFFVFIFISNYCYSQTIRGTVTDFDTKVAIPFATLFLESKLGVKTAQVADSAGLFKFSNIESGRYKIGISCVGYKPILIKDVLVINGKDVILELYLNSFMLEEVIVSKPKYEAPISSSKTINIEQISKYAGTWGDPARMAMSNAGVTAISDESNELVIRGNSPKGMLWMLDGVEIPSPNHFSSDGATGGSVSALSTSVLGNSTFLTGAFPAKYGNAVSGVFDVNLKTGNNEKRESNINIGLLGIELGTEGPLTKKKSSSYLLNYRFYNTKLVESLGLINGINNNGKIISSPKFNDFTFKLKFPFKKSKLSIWGIYGLSNSNFNLDVFYKLKSQSNFHITSSSLFVPIGKNAYWESILSYSGNQNFTEEESSSKKQSIIDFSNINYSSLRLVSKFNLKLNNSNIIQFGTIFSENFYKLNAYKIFNLINLNTIIKDENLKENGNALFWQSYINNKFNTRNITLNYGLHFNYFFLNKNKSLEPRLNISYSLNTNLNLTFGYGVHSRLEPVSVYLFKNNLLLNGKIVNNRNLALPKSNQIVLGINYISNNSLWKFSSEVYYQKLSQIGVVDTTIIKGNEYYSTINNNNSIFLKPLNSTGSGRNYGLESTIEKNINSGIYFVFTSSIFNSTYDVLNKKNLPTRFNNKFVFNLLGGKEWALGKNLLNINFRNVWAGGIRKLSYKIVDDYPEYDLSNGFVSHLKNYNKLDMKVNYILNAKKTTSTFSIDFTNLTNNLNPLDEIYNPSNQKMQTIYQLGFLPVFYYKLNF